MRGVASQTRTTDGLYVANSQDAVFVATLHSVCTTQQA